MRAMHQALAAAAAVLALSSAVQAATVTIAGNYAYSPSPSAIGGSLSYFGTPSTYTSTPVAAGFIGSLNGAPGYSFLPDFSTVAGGGSYTFCVELFQLLPVGANLGSYTVVDPAAGGYLGSTSAYAPASLNGWGSNAALISQQVDKLMAYALSGSGAAAVANADDVAGLQLALWEVIYDYSSTYAYNLSGGNLQVSAFAAPILSKAATYLAGFASATPTRHYYVATDADLQDVLVVPEPGSLMLAGAAFAALALTRRRPAAR